MINIVRALMLSLIVSSIAVAEPIKKQPSTVIESFKNTAPEAISDAIVVDFVLGVGMWGLGLGTAPAALVGGVTSALGYMVRKTCNDYQVQNGVRDPAVSTLCGFAGGALKYTTRSLVLGKYDNLQPLVGALDGGLYEATSHLRGAYPTTEYMAIEALVSLAQYMQQLSLNQAALGTRMTKAQKAIALKAATFSAYKLFVEMRMGAAVGALVSAAVHTTLPWYGAYVSNKVSQLSSYLWSSQSDKREL